MQPRSSTSGGLAFMVRALRRRNYRLFFGGQLISLIGTWMTTIATSWLVYRLTGSALLLGLVGFAGQFPAFLLAPVAGIFVDRWNQHRLLVATQTLSMLESVALAVLTLTGRINVGWILALNAFQGLVNAFDMPGRQAFLVTMIEGKEDLGNAIALNSSMVNAARLLGPSIGGLIIAARGEGFCFAFDGVSYLAVIGALLGMRLSAPSGAKRRAAGAWEELREGWDYVSGFLPARSIILLLALVSLVGVPYSVLVPIFAGRILHGGPHTLGLLMACSGLGALCGAVWLASRRSVLGLGRAIPIATACFGLGLAAFAYSRVVWLSAVLMVVTGAGFMIQMASSNTILQTIVDDDKRGRVMSYFMMAFMGTAPFGSLLAGGFADRLGAPAALLFGGACCVVAAGWFALRLPDIRRAIRPIYARLGLLSQAETVAIAAAEQLLTPPRD